MNAVLYITQIERHAHSEMGFAVLDRIAAVFEAPGMNRLSLFFHSIPFGYLFYAILLSPKIAFLPSDHSTVRVFVEGGSILGYRTSLELIFA